MDKFTYLQSLDYIEETYQRYLRDPEAVDLSWRYFFEGMEFGLKEAKSAKRKMGWSPVTPPPRPPEGMPAGSTTVSPAPGMVEAEAGVGNLIQRYRELGVHIARMNPLEEPLESHPLLELSVVGLSEADLDRKYTAARLLGFEEPLALRDILAHLKATYCGSVGVEYTHIDDPFPREWIKQRMEGCQNRALWSNDTKKHILSRLTDAETFERFLHTRYVAQKRFSLEGGDALIPMLDMMIETAGELGATEMVLGMAHRGRLNVLANIFGKKLEFIFSEFEGSADVTAGEGDVKYHMGYNSEFTTRAGKKLGISLAFNPSHLEWANPVVEGMAYGRQLRTSADQYDAQTRVLPVLIHGDAAFAGQGVVYETLQLSKLRGYTTGGTIHIVVNNQVGFTASPEETRSTSFATDLAKMLHIPILHVNGDDPEACVYVMQLAAEYRQMFHRDIVIDLLCYRKYGHNEGDEPSFTQPLMYRKIREHRSPRELYQQRLENEGTLKGVEAQALIDRAIEKMTAAQADARAGKKASRSFVFDGEWKGLRRATEQDLFQPVDTRIKKDRLLAIAKRAFSAPEGFEVHPKLVRLLAQRAKSVETGAGIDWGTGELLAYGSLLVEGTPVRLSGQDVERGTFSHRHGVLYGYESGERFIPLNSLEKGQSEIEICNSPLSEGGVLGFEWGISIVDPRKLVIWEAQFGDFANSAQVIIDQFIAASEGKWQRMSGLVLLLPHGYEGQGPEHSSARLERFLQLCARKNIQVANLTTPAQLFHALRRQLAREFRKPLFIMSPKSLLRHPSAVSAIEDFSDGSFLEVIDDTTVLKNARRVILCSGKVYYDLDAERKARKLKDVALVRIEQLYPWPRFLLRPVLKNYAKAREVVWVQEEPRNMGAWPLVEHYLPEDLYEGQRMHVVARSPSAVPAVGSHKVHERQQRTIVEQALSEEAFK